MERTSQNIIYNSSFNFEYGNKASASRCNILIESMFNSHILPELDKAISSCIPEGVSVELSKLEINIGTIDENELSTNLAGRIRASLEDALRNAIRIKQSGINGKDSLLEQSSFQYLNQFIENFLLKGYFQFGIEKSVTIDDLVSKTIQQNKGAFVEIINKHAQNNSVIRRIAYSFSLESFDLILSTLFPANSAWIINYREILISLKNDNKLLQLNDNEFIRKINYAILNYLLNETSLTFNKTKFSESILNEFIVLFNPDSELFIKSLQEYKEKNSPMAILITEGLIKIKEEEYQFQAEDKNENIDLGYVLKLLNSGNIAVITLKQQLLKAEIILAINNKSKRELLIKGLESNGVRSILKLFAQKSVNALHELILSFTSYFNSLKNGGGATENISTINEFVLYTVLYLNESDIRELDKEEFVLFLIYAGGLEDSETVKSTSFQNWMQSEESIDSKKVRSLFEEEQHYPEISRIQKLLLKSEKPAESGEELKTADTRSEDYSIIYKRKIVRYYLDSGRLPDAFVDLNWKEIQSLFIDLIHQKDEFLFETFKINEDANKLINRLNLLIDGLLSDDLNAYLIHFFHEENSILTEIITEVEQNFAVEENSRIWTEEFKTELFIRALAESKGGTLIGIFMVSALEYLNAELQRDFIDTTSLVPSLFSKSETNRKKDLLQKHYHLFEEESNEKYKKIIEKELKILANKLQFKEFEPEYYGEDLRRTIQKIAFYSRVDQKGFLSIIQKQSDNLLQFYSLFNYYLPQNQWQLIEKVLLPKAKLTEELQTLKKSSDVVISKIRHPKSDLGTIFKNTKQADELKALLMLIISDDALFDKFVLKYNGSQLPQKLILESGKTGSVLNKLYTFFTDLVVSGINDKKFGKSLVFSFAILIFLEEKTFTTISLAKAFLSHLLQKLSTINETGKFYSIMQKMSSSDIKELKKIPELWSVSEKSETSESDTITDLKNKVSSFKEEKLNSSKEIEYYFSILQFYANNGFFPWWAKNISFPELIIGFKRSSKLYPAIFEETFLRLEKEHHIFEHLIGTISKTLFDEFERIVSSHSSLQSTWNEIIQKAQLKKAALNTEYDKQFTEEVYTNNELSVEQLIKSDYKDKESLFKSLYYLNDKEILKTWFKQNTEIANQIKEYLALSPYFYFRNVNPAQWRKMVYEFSFDFYKADTAKLNNQFHTNFLNYLQRNYTSINWPEILGKVYRVTQSEKTSGRVFFPEPLIKLLNPELIKTPKRNEVMGDAEIFSTDETVGNVVMIDNAGLILFWPFLVRLFENLSFVENGNFISSESRNRAVYLLQQLVCNDINFPEYKLVLNKLLVGMPAEEHLMPIEALNDEELEIAKSLLNGLIHNWDKVANSTPEGIQETFLKREGVLTFETDKVVLSVEKKGVDVLMNSIPWNISLIKLAWMQKPLHVNWL